ncbi:S-layer homology domain-containing protein [Paenibacillus qinlingensis]|uniref:S-layer homology domain-containing protein n=1 Tax=Paenibacillus qinlingensis TaxID=1837343 RepID=UPI00156319D6|nr:S-layer homology domain-containing protein [Paenibacillus qinlingensis]NQX59262.1 S-layer homology domain-containing protein [Paenibacillus qinlingensis]
MKFHLFKSKIAIMLIFSMLFSMILLPTAGMAAVDPEVVVSTLPPSADGAIHWKTPDIEVPSVLNTVYDKKNGSTDGLFSVSTSSTQKKQMYFKFDVSNAADLSYKYILQVSAKLGSGLTTADLQVFGLTDNSWQESTFTWNNATALQKDLSLMEQVGQFTITTLNGVKPIYHDIDVSDYVRRHLADGVVSFVVADALVTGKSVNLYSKDNTSVSNPETQLLVKRVVQSDTTPPQWPNGAVLNSINLGTDFVQLAWPAATDDSAVSNYKIYQNDMLLQTVVGSTYYTAQGLSPSTNVTYAVYAGDVAGNYTTLPLTYSTTTLAAPVTPIPVVEVNASSSDGNVESNTLDNNLYSRWSASGDGQYIMFDLGQSKRIGYVGIAFYKGDLRSTRLDIETSNDALTWTNVFSGNSRMITANMQAFDIPDTDARFVRIIGHGNSDGSTFTSLTDVMIYAPYVTGDTPVAIVPNITPTAPPGAVPFTKAGLTNPDGTEHVLHTPNPVTGATINVTSYGADPADNGNDDRVAIQNAINAASPGDEVYLPNGVYNLITSPDGFVNLKLKSGVNLRGQSEEETILKSSIDDIKNSSVVKSSSQHDILVSNLTISSTWNRSFSLEHATNNPEAGGPDSSIAIANYGDTPSYNVTIDHVTVERFRRMAIRIENSHDVVVRHSTFRNATDLGGGGAGYGTSIQGMPKVDRLGFDNDTYWNVVEDSTFEGPYLRHGSLIQNVAHNNTLRNNRYIRTKLDAIDLHGELEYLNEVYGNTIEDIWTGGGVGLGNTGGTAPTNHSKSGPKNHIHDNIIRNSREGIVVTMGTPETLIENNVIENTTSVVNAAGINILNGPGTRIINNTIRNNTATDYWGILLEHDNGDLNANYVGAGDPQNVEIVGNIITGNSNGIRLQAGTNIHVSKNILNNLGTNYDKAVGVTATEVWPSTDNTLSGLGISAGTLSPTFDAATTAYTSILPDGISEILITPTTNNSGAKVTVNGATIVSGSTSNAIQLQAGDNVIEIVVAAEDLSTKTYQLTVTRVLSTNNNLSNLALSAGTLSPTFDAETTEYTSNVSNGVTEIQVTPTVANSATVSVNGNEVVSGSASTAIQLQVGDNVIAIVVTSENLLTKTYRLKVTRDHSSSSSSSAGSNPPSNASDSLKAKTTEVDGKTVATATLDEKTLDTILKAQGEGSITIVVDSPSDVGQVQLTLSHQALQKLSGIPSATIETEIGSVKLPLNQLNVSQFASQLGDKPENVQIQVNISKNENASAQANAAGFKVVYAIDFSMKAVVGGGKSATISSFSSYVPYTVQVDPTIKERNLAAVIVVKDEQGNTTYEPVPLTMKSGEVTLYSHSNETFLLIENNISFKDTNKHWAKDGIERMANKWLVQGVSKEEFRPDQPITRAELATLLTRTLGIKSSNGTTTFKDLSHKDWFNDFVHAAVEGGIITGYEDGTFRPNQTITREEMAVMIDRALQAAGYDDQQATGNLPAFTDQKQIKSWSADAVRRLVQLQLMQGMSPTSFDPEKEATRAQSAVLLQRLLQILTFTK